MRIRLLFAFICLFNAFKGYSQGFHNTYQEDYNVSVGRIVTQPDGYQLRASSQDLTSTVIYYSVLGVGPDGTLQSHSKYTVQNPDRDYVIQTLDSNFVFAGLSANNLPSLTKKTADGTVLWNKEYALPGTSPVGGFLVEERENGELYLAGIEYSSNSTGQPSYRVMVVRATPEGDVIYNKVNDYNGQQYWVANSIKQLVVASDGGCYISAMLNVPVVYFNLMKLNPAGDKVYHQNMLPSDVGRVFSLIPSVDGTCAYAYFHGISGPLQLPWRYFLGQFSTNGTLNWSLSPLDLLPFGNLPVNERYATLHAVGSVPGGGFILAGSFGQWSEGLPVNVQFYVMQLHANGNLDWMKTDYDFIPNVRTIKATEGGCILFGGSAPLNTSPFVGTWMMRTDQFGELDGAPTQQTNIQASICEGEHFEVGDSSFTVSGNYTIPFISANGCDSTVVLELTVAPVDSVVLDIDLCQGELGPLSDTFYGIPGEFIEQAIFINQNGCDSTVTATITVHPEELIWADNGPLPYGMIYHGVALTQDTQFVLYDTTEFGCLLTISENVTVMPSAVGELAQMLNLRVFPNPTSAEFFIEMDLPSAMAISLEAIDPLGRRVAALVENGFYQSGKQKLKLDASQWPSGVYLLHFQVDGTSFFKKIIKKQLH